MVACLYYSMVQRSGWKVLNEDWNVEGQALEVDVRFFSDSVECSRLSGIVYRI